MCLGQERERRKHALLFHGLSKKGGNAAPATEWNCGRKIGDFQKAEKGVSCDLSFLLDYIPMGPEE